MSVLMWFPVLDIATEKEPNRKTGEVWIKSLNFIIVYINFLALMTISWLYEMLTVGGTGWRAYEIIRTIFGNCVNLKLLKNKLFKKSFKVCIDLKQSLLLKPLKLK